VIPVSSGVGQGATATDVNRNIVRGVQPASQIWVIRKLKAEVTTNGAIKGEGEGLMLGGGHHVGRATGQRVFATRICETTAPFTERHADLVSVSLDPHGGFAIDDVLTPAPPIPCASPMLLICSASGRKRFAAGILEQD
jgi:hypothetical protein